MKVLSRLVNEKYAMPFAGFMEWICRLIMLYMALCLVLSVMGRQTFTLLMNGKEYENAYCAQESPRSGSRMWTVHSDDDITVNAGYGGSIGTGVSAALSLIFALELAPAIVSYWYLGRVFRNVSRGVIFTEKNAAGLLYYGLIQTFIALFVPFLKTTVQRVANRILDCSIYINPDVNIFDNFCFGVAFVVAAYIIHYGIALQDEVDHTI